MAANGRSFFSIPLPEGSISYSEEEFDLVLAVEPFKGLGPKQQVNPLVIRNRDEILSREQALQELKLQKDRQNCLLAYNGNPGDFERVRKRFTYLQDMGYVVFSTTNYKEGLFPAVDYFNAFDLVICGASYNSFWETIYFDKEAIYIPTETRFVRGERLIKEYRNYRFHENGADQLVGTLLHL